MYGPPKGTLETVFLFAVIGMLALVVGAVVIIFKAMIVGGAWLWIAAILATAIVTAAIVSAFNEG